MNQLIRLQKKALHIMSFECRNARSNPLFLDMKSSNFQTKLSWKTAYLSVNLLILLILQFSIIFIFSSDSSNYETFRSSKGLLKVKTVKTKTYGKEAMINNAVLSWNNIQKINVLSDLSYSKLKSLLVKQIFLKTYSNKD